MALYENEFETPVVDHIPIIRPSEGAHLPILDWFQIIKTDAMKKWAVWARFEEKKKGGGDSFGYVDFSLCMHKQ